MGTVRDIAGQQVMTHYFTTTYEVRKFVGDGRETGWYYQVGSDPKATMHGPFRLLESLVSDVEKRDRKLLPNKGE